LSIEIIGAKVNQLSSITGALMIVMFFIKKCDKIQKIKLIGNDTK